jgi:hypothetical protein
VTCNVQKCHMYPFFGHLTDHFVFLFCFRQITKVGGSTQVITVPGFGDNSMVKRPVNIGDVTKLSVYFSGSGTITYIKDRICPTGGSFPPPPPATCTKDFYQNECCVNTDCVNMYGNATSICNTSAGIGSVCYCGVTPCGCLHPVPWT